MNGIFFTDDHEYIKVEGSEGVVGISNYAQEALGDIVYIELPQLGAKLAKGAQAGVVESVKSASEIYSPVSGEVIAVNHALPGDPALVNNDSMGKGWLYKISIADEAELESLKDEAEYMAYIES